MTAVDPDYADRIRGEKDKAMADALLTGNWDIVNGGAIDDVCQRDTQEAMFGMLSVFSQFERTLIRERQAEGIARGKAQGKKLGRPVMVDDKKRVEIVNKLRDGSNPSQLSKEYNISRATIYRIRVQQINKEVAAGKTHTLIPEEFGMKEADVAKVVDI